MTKIIDYGFRQAYRIAYPIMQLFRPFFHQDGVCVAIWVKDRVLVVRHSYKPGLSIPGGGVKKGEHARVGAARELREEVGININAFELNLIHSKRFSHHRGTNYFYELHLAIEPQIIIDQREIIYAEFLSAAEIRLSGCDRYFASYLDARNTVHDDYATAMSAAD
jgi:8-oxo-dGTP diphosphatase